MKLKETDVPELALHICKLLNVIPEENHITEMTRLIICFVKMREKGTLLVDH